LKGGEVYSPPGLPRNILLDGFKVIAHWNPDVLILLLNFFSIYRYFPSDNEPDGIENATHNTFAKQS
jgi:hypothetical protein